MRTSNPNRIRLLRINLVLLDRPGHILARHLSILRQRGNRRMRDVVPIHLKEAAQVRTRVRAAEAIGAEDGVGHRDEGADLVGEGGEHSRLRRRPGPGGLPAAG